MEPNLVVQAWALLLLVGLPLLAARDAGREEELERAAEFRRSIYVSIAVSLLVIAAVTLGIAAWQDVPGRALGWRVEAPGGAIAWSAAITAAGLLMAWLVGISARTLGLRESRLARLLMPRDAAEKRAFLLLAGVGAVCEEYVFRGFLLAVLESWSGSAWVAVAGTALSFGLAHGYQRLAGMARATLLGVLLALPVVWTGSLFPAVVAHFWINAAIGLGGWRWMIAGSDDGSRDGGGGHSDA